MRSLFVAVFLLSLPLTSSAGEKRPETAERTPPQVIRWDLHDHGLRFRRTIYRGDHRPPFRLELEGPIHNLIGPGFKFTFRF